MKDFNNSKTWRDSITDVSGVKVGHSQDVPGGTGCTVIIFEQGAVTGVEVRGGAPGTRETDLLNPINLVDKVQAIYLSGGSAFGLDGATGVMQYLEERGIGFDVGLTKVPIVPAAVLYDLNVGDYRIRPDAKMGYQACLNSSVKENRQGNIGAGTGATVGKVRGVNFCMKGGLGTASISCGKLRIGAIAAVNCFGDIIDPSNGKIIAGALTDDKKQFINTVSYLKNSTLTWDGANRFPANTTIGAIATNAHLNKTGATKVAMMAQNGFARAIIPVHTMFDGDTIFCASTGDIEAEVSLVGTLAAELMVSAIIKAVKSAESSYGITGYQGLL